MLSSYQFSMNEKIIFCAKKKKERKKRQKNEMMFDIKVISNFKQ